MRRLFREAWLRWKRIAERIAHVQALVIFTLLYFVVVAPFAVVLKTFGDPLRMRRARPLEWGAPPRQTRSLAEAHRQF